MSKICVTTVVNGIFHGYVPLFMYSVKTAYPDADVLIFYADPPHEYVVTQMTRLLGVFGGIRVISDDLCLRAFPVAPRIAAGLRWFVFSEARASAYLEEYDYVYVCDVDIMICPETPTLIDQHVGHCLATHLPYSNLLRAGVPVLTGLHFVTREYIDKVARTASWYEEQFRQHGWGVLDRTDCNHDERLLYHITRDAGIGFPRQYVHDSDVVTEVSKMSPECFSQDWFRPEHGVHIGYAKNNTSDAELQWLFDHVPSFTAHMQWLIGLSNLVEYYNAIPCNGKQMIDRYMSIYRRIQ